MPFPFETSRLVLRHFCAHDLDALLAYRNDPQVYRYQGWTVPYTRIDGLGFIRFMQKAMPGTAGEWFQAALELKSSGEMIGDVAFHLRQGRPQEAYVGYTLAQPYWHQGYASESMRCLLDYLFIELNLHRVVAECDVRNTASRKLLERLGLRREGHFIEDFWIKNHWVDDYLYAILRREWTSQ